MSCVYLYSKTHKTLMICNNLNHKILYTYNLNTKLHLGQNHIILPLSICNFTMQAKRKKINVKKKNSCYLIIFVLVKHPVILRV